MNGRFSGWRQVRASGHGRNRAAFWRALGFPNLVRARAVYAKMKAEKKQATVGVEDRANLDKRRAELASNIDALRRK